MRRMKKAGQYLLGIFAALLLCGVFSVNIVKAESQYVYDNASLFSDEEEQDLERSCTEFERNTKLHMVILTERSSGSEDCQAIADDFYDKKYPKEPNGVCFLIDMGQRQIVISTSVLCSIICRTRKLTIFCRRRRGTRKTATMRELLQK